HLLGRNGYRSSFGDTDLTTSGWLYLAKIAPLLMANTDEKKGPLLSGSVFPNPSSGEGVLQIETENAASGRISLLNIAGSVVMPPVEVTFHAGLNKVKLPDNLPAGIYQIQFQHESGYRLITPWIRN
ncbi:MAG: T9SS type A sorting domain-containing protein, partial [Bacteroidota bacterium]